MAETGDGRLPSKMEVDYTSSVDELLPEAKSLAEGGRLEEALEKLLNLEKQTRTGADMVSTSRILVAVVEMCFEAKNWELLNEHLILLTKRRGQLKQAVTKMVQKACGYVDETPDLQTKLKFIDTLRTVTLGKIHVEVERARLTKKLALIKEAEGEVAEAAKILQDLQVETFGSMEKREKVEFILEQMRLCLANKDFVRLQIISKKISVRFFEDEKQQDLKLRYYEMMIVLGQHDCSYLTVCKHYRAVYQTPSIQEDEEKRKQALRHVALFAALAPFDNEQSDLVHRITAERDMELIPTYRSLLKLFTTQELVRWKQLCANDEKELREGTATSPATGVFSPSTEDGQKNWTELSKRVVEHNIYVIAKYYTQIRLQRMAVLLDLSVEEAESFLSKLVVAKSVYARIDRLAGIVSFQRQSSSSQLLNNWSHSINDLMALVNKTCHLIQKEEMVHRSLANKAAEAAKS